MMTDIISLVFSIGSIVAWVVTHINKIKILEKNDTKHETAIKDLQNEIDELRELRYKDSLAFSEILSKFNVNLTRFDVTLSGMNDTLKEIKTTLNTHSEKLSQLHGRKL